MCVVFALLILVFSCASAVFSSCTLSALFSCSPITCAFSVLFISVLSSALGSLTRTASLFRVGMSTYSLYGVWVVRVFNAHNAFPLIQKFQGGRSRYKLLVSLKLTCKDAEISLSTFATKLIVSVRLTMPTLQGYRNFMVEVRVANL